MRLRLFRGRNWWAGLRFRRRPAGSPDRRGSSVASAQGPRPGGPGGSHRKTGKARSPSPDLIGLPEQPPASGRADGEQALAGEGRPSSTGTRPTSTRPPGASHAVPSQWSRTARSRPRLASSQSAIAASAGTHAAARAAIKTRPDAVDAAHDGLARSASASKSAAISRQDARADDGQPWYAATRSGAYAAGQRNCGCLEDVLVREWAVDEEPAPEAAAAINRLAALPLLVKEKLAAGLDAIHVGAGGVPDLDQMGQLKGVPLPSGRATWDACAGAYGNRKIVVGSRPSPTPDVMCHEVGHALDDIDGSDGCWQSDSADYRALYGRCLPHMASEFHRHGSLGRREFFADAFAAIASSQRPALVEMLSGDTRTALDVMLYFNVRYGM